MSDPGTYRTKEELEKYRELDPIAKLTAQLMEEGTLSKEQLEEMDNRAKQIALDAVKFAEESPEPPESELYNYTFVNTVDGGVAVGAN